MNYDEAVAFLYSLGNEVSTAKLGLERISLLLQALGNPERSCRFVHVAGTNGKGSTCAMIESALRAQGVRTGLYTSPHLVDPTERIQINGAPVTRLDFAEAFQEVHDTAERIGLDMHPTYFETLTAMAFVLFAEARIETVVLETGLGGRLDATNVVRPELTVITSIDFDHQRFLGETIESIAFEKAGILKPGVPSIFAPQREEAAAVLRAQAQGPFQFAQECPIENLHYDSHGSHFQVCGKNVICPLPGLHQVENARCAALALAQLGFTPEGIGATQWPGRLEHVSEQPTIILDGAHNPAGARSLAAYLNEFYAHRRIVLVFGVMRDKAVAEIAATLFPLADRIILTSARNARAMTPEEIGAPHAEVTQNVADAVAVTKNSAPEDVIVITGSLFVVGEARALLVK